MDKLVLELIHKGVPFEFNGRVIVVKDWRHPFKYAEMVNGKLVLTDRYNVVV